MITKYYDFIHENNSYSESDPEYWGITDYKWVDGRLNVHGDVNLNVFTLKNNRLPFIFGEIHGEFSCINCGITDLNPESPQIVHKDYFIADNKIYMKDLGNYPVCIIYGDIFCSGNLKDNVGGHYFYEVANLVREHSIEFIPLLDNKIAFHHQIMRLRPDLIPEYKTIDPPSRKSII